MFPSSKLLADAGRTALIVSAFAIRLSSFAAEPRRVLIVVGPTDHPPGTHEVAAGGRVLQHCLANMANVPK